MRYFIYYHHHNNDFFPRKLYLSKCRFVFFFGLTYTECQNIKFRFNSQIGSHHPNKEEEIGRWSAERHKKETGGGKLEAKHVEKVGNASPDQLRVFVPNMNSTGETNYATSCPLPKSRLFNLFKSKQTKTNVLKSKESRWSFSVAVYNVSTFFNFRNRVSTCLTFVLYQNKTKLIWINIILCYDC